MKTKQTSFIGLIFCSVVALAIEAQATFFGFIPAPCEDGDIHVQDRHQCYYCPEGTELRGDECKGRPKIGDRCPHGVDHMYNAAQRKCVYCQSDYVFLFRYNECRDKYRTWEEL